MTFEHPEWLIGIPLLVEGQLIGLLGLDRHRVEPFDDEDLHRAKTVAFSAAGAIHKAQLLENVRRYAMLMERVVEVNQAVFAGKGRAEVARLILSVLVLPLTPAVLLCAFLLFRVFDVVKPFPADRAQALPGGFGVMADDLIAGAYALALLAGVRAWLGVPA